MYVKRNELQQNPYCGCADTDRVVAVDADAVTDVALGAVDTELRVIFL